jgi:hypothetical protein
MATPGVPDRFREKTPKRFQTLDHVTFHSDRPPPGVAQDIVVRGPRWTAYIPTALLAGLVSGIGGAFIPHPNPDVSGLQDELRAMRLQRERETEENRRDVQALHDEIRDVKTRLSLYEVQSGHR